jgi:hypothetical protein
VSDSAETASFEAVPEESSQPVTASAGAAWPQESASDSPGGSSENPEFIIGAAFLGGLALATILKRFAP